MRSERAKSAAYENEKALFGFYSSVRLLFGFTHITSCQPASGWGYVGGNTAEGQNALLHSHERNIQYSHWLLLDQQQQNRQLQYGRRRWDAFCQHRRRQHGNWRRGRFE